MKKYKKLIVFCITILLLSGFSPLKNNDLIDFKDVISTISELEGISLNITSIKDMKDIQGESNYFFIKMNKGYAIITKEKVISEYSLDEDSIPYDDDEEELVYAGPYNYYSNKTQINQSMISKESFNKVVNQNNKVTSEINLNLNLQLSDEMLTQSLTWVGLHEFRFEKYGTRQWINNNSNFPASQGYPIGGICGTIAAATLLSYYDDYINDKYVPSYIQPRHITGPSSLITSLYPYIDKGKNGTIPTDIRVGITKWMGSQNIPMYVGEVESTLLGTSSIAKSRINNSRPILVGR